jgi:hypothetical protein
LGLPEQHKVLVTTTRLVKSFPTHSVTIVQTNKPDIPRAASVSFCFKRGYNPPESLSLKSLRNGNLDLMAARSLSVIAERLLEQGSGQPCP